MFALHTPQTVTLAVPGEDGPFTTINFRTAEGDTSRCIMELVTPEGDIHRVTFTTRGALVDTQYIDHENPEMDPIYPHDYMVDGRDTRADNPYTHTAPMDADTAYRPAAGFTAPVPLDGEGKPVVDDAEERPKAMKAAEEAAKKARDEREKQASENAEQRRERLAQEREVRDPDGNAPSHATPVPPQPIPAGNPNISSGVHGNVNTTQSMRDNTNQQAAQNNYRPEPANG